MNDRLNKLTRLFAESPAQWMVPGGVQEMSSNQFQLSVSQATHYAYRFYRWRSL